LILYTSVVFTLDPSSTQLPSLIHIFFYICLSYIPTVTSQYSGLIVIYLHKPNGDFSFLYENHHVYLGLFYSSVLKTNEDAFPRNVVNYQSINMTSYSKRNQSL